jgi:hypothetical protein
VWYKHLNKHLKLKKLKKSKVEVKEIGGKSKVEIEEVKEIEGQSMISRRI